MSAEHVTGSVTTGGWLDLLRFPERGDVPEWLGHVGVRVCERPGIADVEAAES